MACKMSDKRARRDEGRRNEHMLCGWASRSEGSDSERSAKDVVAQETGLRQVGKEKEGEIRLPSAMVKGLHTVRVWLFHCTQVETAMPCLLPCAPV